MSDDQIKKIIVTRNGPYVISGAVPLTVQTIGSNTDGESVSWEAGRDLNAGATYALCRCGHSKNAPYCDGTHATIRFDGTETASRASYSDQMEPIEGPGFVLEDAKAFCAAARFCDTSGSSWELVNKADDPESRATLLQQVAHCPSGRLVLRDVATGSALEPEFEPGIGIVEDPAGKCSGPISVRGGIKLESMGGEAYETRNRVTLCRCGASKNKPFCDGAHAEIVYRDGIA